jgi:hypothetical protein
MISFKNFISEKVEFRRMGPMSGRRIYPMAEELSDRDLKTLLSIKTPDDIESIENASWWTDDSQHCFGIKINGVNVSFWYRDEQLKKYIENYADKGMGFSSRKIIFNTVRSEIERMAYLDKDNKKRVERIQNEIKRIDVLKPEAQNLFKGMIEEL